MDNETLEHIGHAMDCIANVKTSELEALEALHVSEAYCILAEMYYSNGGKDVRTECTFLEIRPMGG